jgi:hypothetical protein
MGAIVMRGGRDRYILFNTLWDYDAGIKSPTSAGFTHIENNILGGRTSSDGRDLFLEVLSVADASNFNNNMVYGSPVRLQWGNGVVHENLAAFQSASGKGHSSFERDPRFINARVNNLNLLSSSPAIDTGIANTVFDTYFSLYGVDIKKDIEGQVRPHGPAWDIGAYEFGSSGTLPPDTTSPMVSITAPSNNATVSGTITISGTASDNVGVVGVQFQVDGGNTGSEDTSAPYDYVLNTIPLSDGTHVITAVAKDADGNNATSSVINITVNEVGSTWRQYHKSRFIFRLL